MPDRRRVLLIQLPIPPLGPQPIRGNVPLAAGYLKLFARSRGLEHDFDIDILPADQANRLGDQALVETICRLGPWMVGFTCYLWNIDRTLWVAEQVKRRTPGTLVIIGGPEITSDNEWVLGSPAIDFAAIGEGEQTFAELLEKMRSVECGVPMGADLGEIRGLVHRVGGRMAPNLPRSPMANIDAISSPYLAGMLNAGDQEQLLIETIRGCIFKCKFCYYPKAYDGLYYVSRDKVLANLEHARDNGAKEVYLLDPTLNQRRDFADFLQWLKDGNPDGQLEYYAELRAEGLNADQARLMREANFKEVEIGLQSIDPKTQDLMERRNNLKAFEKGVRALQAEGIKVKVDLIVGLPGDTIDSVRRGMHYLADNRLYDEIQVFQLSILPGTAFRQEAALLGLDYQPRPPYYVLRTPTLTLDDMLGLLEESETIFDTEFDPLPPPSLDLPRSSPSPLWGEGQGEGSEDELATSLVVDLDARPYSPPSLPTRTTQAFTIWFRTRDPYARLAQATAVVREHLQANPFSTLQIVIETGGEFPFDVFDGLRVACERPANIYLDRFYEFTPGRTAGSSRCVILLPERLRDTLDSNWQRDVGCHADLEWSPRSDHDASVRRFMNCTTSP
jgi:radical SAM superfamily enzyme YgiQ (UPF0313 family)